MRKTRLRTIRTTILAGLIALFMALPLAAPAQAAPPTFPFSDLDCSIVARPTLTGRLNVYVNVDEQDNDAFNNLWVQIRDNGNVFAAGGVRTRLPWNYRDRVANRGGVDVFTLTVYDRTTGELCSDYYITGLIRGPIRDFPDLPPVL